jgi:hypothetical protein
METASQFSVGITPRGFCLVEHRGIVSRPVTNPEPTNANPQFLALQLKSCSQERRDAFLREQGCMPLDHLPLRSRFSGVIV